MFGPMIVAKAHRNGYILTLIHGSALDVSYSVLGLPEPQKCALVNAANEELIHGGGIAGEIISKGGEEIITESKMWIAKNGKVNIGGIAATGPGKLPFTTIVHAVGPKSRDSLENRNMLISTLTESMRWADHCGCYFINIPGISCGIFDFPKNVSATCHFDAFFILTSQFARIRNLKMINFCLFGNEEFNIFLNEMINRSDNFDVFEYFGTKEDMGLSVYCSYCDVCKLTKGLDNFKISQNCCFGQCDDCFARYGQNKCFKCNTVFNPQHFNRKP